MIYKIVVDKQPMTNPSEEKKEYEIDIEELHFKRDVYDSLVITLNEDYVMRRLELGEYNVLTELDPPVKEPLEDINIELFEGDNYIYLYDMAGNKIVAQYLVKNEFNELYITQSEMNSAIEQSAKTIELSVNGKIKRVDGDIEDLSASLELKIDKNDNDQVVSMINASADEIKLKSNRLIIDSTNFKLNGQGNITATGGTIGNFNISNKSLTKQINSIYKYSRFDQLLVAMNIMEKINIDSNMSNILDANNSGNISSSDYVTIKNIINGTTTNTKSISGVFEINADDVKNCVAIKDSFGNIVLSLGLGGINSNFISANQCVIGQAGTTYDTATYVAINGNTGNISATGTITQGSLKETKKNIVKFNDNAINIIKNIDIYKYNFKSEKEEDKKHIGFVIGKDYKYSSEITSIDEKGKEIGVDTYSFVSVCCKAIQEQQEQIEKLQKENQQKDEILANLIERLEKLEKEGQIC